MQRSNAITTEIQELEQRAQNLQQEYEFARSRMLAHAERTTLRERAFYAGARLRMEELAEELEILSFELDALKKEAVCTDGMEVH